ncbi:MAG TPA: formylglycine-generating enzyme family protein [Minicystis sp.]|nr:formylglycine-generating enzyme family protein [Minicystis sp.]
MRLLQCRSPRGSRHRAALVSALGGAAVLLGAACAHDWGFYDPASGGAPSSSASSGAGGAGAGGASSSSGTGGAPVTCPKLGDAKLVPVPTDIGGFCIDDSEVTNRAYKAWLDTGPSTVNQPPYCSSNASFLPAGNWPPSSALLDHPVRFVDWCDARAYCESVGEYLCGSIQRAQPLAPTDFSNPGRSQWYRACSSNGGRTFPYGDTYEATACDGIDYGATDDAGAATTIVVKSAKGCVGGYLGLYDMSGNVWEWEDACDAALGKGDACRIRGGGFTNTSDSLSCTASSTVARDTTAVNVGFRCCADACPKGGC